MTNIEDEDLREEHLQAIKVHRKRKDYEVFVGGLDWYQFYLLYYYFFFMSDALVIYLFIWIRHAILVEFF